MVEQSVTDIKIPVSSVRKNYPHFFKAVKLLAQDNQLLVNRDFSFPSMERKNLFSSNKYLSTLSEEQVDTIVCGENTERESLIKSGGEQAKVADDLIHEIFDGDYIDLLI